MKAKPTENVVSSAESPDAVMNNDTQKDGSKLKLITCFLGIFVSYFVYGILQENITKSRYGAEEERFTYTLAMVCVQCIINAAFAQIVIRVTSPPQDTAPPYMYAIMSSSYLGAMLASNHALQYVSYPTQVLGKSAKPIPVMILGVVLARKRYPLLKYLFVLMIVLGVAMFLYKDQHTTTEQSLGWGELLLLVSLSLDGVTGGIQDKIRGDFRTQTHRMMFFMNAWSVLYLCVALVLTGEGLQFLAFVSRFPTVLLQIIIFSLASAIGQNFIFMTVTNFGPLTCSIFTTTRKFFTILTSVIIFQHPLSLRQGFGTVMVFTGLFLDNFYGKEQKLRK